MNIVGIYTQYELRVIYISCYTVFTNTMHELESPIDIYNIKHIGFSNLTWILAYLAERNSNVSYEDKF